MFFLKEEKNSGYEHKSMHTEKTHIGKFKQCIKEIFMKKER